MIQNFMYYLSVLIICLINMFSVMNPKLNNTFTSILLFVSLIIFIYGNYNLLYYHSKDEKYIYVKPKYKPIVISWDNPLAQKII